MVSFSQSILWTLLLGSGAGGEACLGDRCPSEHIVRSAQASPDAALQENVERWLAEAEHARTSGALVAGRPMPDGLTAARAVFETSWRNTGLNDRKKLVPALGRALSLLVRSYRFQETGNPDPRLALYWADEMIAFYEQAASRRQLAEAMLEKAAIYLQVSQLNQTDRERFNQLSRAGDRILQDCMAVAEEDQRPEVLRYWSRFYYNLARPQSGRLSEPWDDRFLQLADQRIDEALKHEPESLRNLNQKARVVQRRARATLPAPLASWATQLWDAQRRLAAAWSKADNSILRAEDRLSPLNVLAMTTLDAVMYSTLITSDAEKAERAPGWLTTLDTIGLPAQLNAWALVRNTELARAYGFDTVYDLSRLHALRGVVMGIVNPGRQNDEIERAVEYLREARSFATVQQLDAAKQSVTGDPVFASLPEFAQTRFRRVLAGAVD